MTMADLGYGYDVYVPFQNKRSNTDPELGEQSSLSHYERGLMGSQYWSSNFPSLLQDVGEKEGKKNGRTSKKKSDESKHVSIRRNAMKQRKNGPEIQVTSDDTRKRNEGHRLKVNALVRDKMEDYEQYCADFYNKVETTRKQIDKTLVAQHDRLFRQEQKKRNEIYENSRLARIKWHHQVMRQRGEEEYRRREALKERVKVKENSDDEGTQQEQ